MRGARFTCSATQNLQFGEVPDALDPDNEAAETQPVSAQRGAAAMAAADRAVGGSAASSAGGITVLGSEQAANNKSKTDEDGDHTIN